MKKKNFFALVSGTASILLFGIGMCMCMLPAWNLFRAGVVFGAAGVVWLLLTWMIYRKLSGKKPIALNGALLLRALYGCFSVLVLGIGMCMCMLWGMLLPGIGIGILGLLGMAAAYPLYRNITRKRREKLAPEILRLTQELLK